MQTIAAGEAVAAERIDPRLLERRVRDGLHQWQALLTTQIEDGRELLRQVLAGPIRFTPDEKNRYRFEGEAQMGRLVAGTIVGATNLACLTPARWNRIAGWLKQIDVLRQAA
jgi:hypothetical protein